MYCYLLPSIFNTHTPTHRHEGLVVRQHHPPPLFTGGVDGELQGTHAHQQAGGTQGSGVQDGEVEYWFTRVHPLFLRSSLVLRGAAALF